MLGSIEKGRTLPQFGRRHNVTSFNKMHPLSWLARCSPVEHFIVFCHLAPPAREGSWHSIPEVTKSQCVPTPVFTFLRGFEGRAALLFFSSPVTNGLWQAPRRSEQELLELVGARSATCPWGWGQGGRKRFCLKAPSDCGKENHWLWQRKSLFRGQANVQDWNGREVLTGRRTGLGRVQWQVTEASWHLSF